MTDPATRTELLRQMAAAAKPSGLLRIEFVHTERAFEWLDEKGSLLAFGDFERALLQAPRRLDAQSCLAESRA